MAKLGLKITLSCVLISYNSRIFECICLLALDGPDAALDANVKEKREGWAWRAIFARDYYYYCSKRSDFIILSRAKRARSLLTARGLSQLPNMLGSRQWRHGAFSVSRQHRLCRRWPRRIIDTRLLCLLIVCETMFAIGESRTISHPNDTELQAQQVPTNPRRERFSIETPRENAD